MGSSPRAEPPSRPPEPRSPHSTSSPSATPPTGSSSTGSTRSSESSSPYSASPSPGPKPEKSNPLTVRKTGLACTSRSSTGEHDGRSQEEEVEVEDPQPSRRCLEARRPALAACARAAATPSSPTRCARRAVGTRTASPSTSTPDPCCRSRSTPWAATVRRTRSSPARSQAAAAGIPVVLVGPADLAAIAATCR